MACKQPKAGWASSNAAPMPPPRSIVPKPGRAIAQPNPPIIYAPNQILYKILRQKKPLQNTTVLLFLDKNIGITFFSLCSLKISKPPSDL